MRSLLIAAAVALVAALPLGAPAADPIEINAMLPVTGPAAFSGKAVQNALELLEPIVNKSGGVNGRPIKFTYLDDQSDPRISIQLTNELIAKNVQWMLGPGVVASCRATEPLLKNGPVQYCQSPAVHPAKGSFLFSGSVSTVDLMLTVVRYARERGWKKLAFITLIDAAGQDGDDSIDLALTLPENKGMELVRREHFGATDISVAAQMARIKGANPQAVILWAPNAPFATLLHGVLDAGIELPMLTTSGNMTYGQIKQYVAFMPKEIYFPGLSYISDVAPKGRQGDAQRAFRAAYAVTGSKPDVQAGFLWDAALILVDALRKYGPNATAQQVHEHIENLHDFYGIAGVYDFRGGNQRGLAANNVVMMRWDNTKLDWYPVSKPGGVPIK